jgi:phage-related tail fiber protein
MAQKYYALTTVVGQSKIANAIALGNHVSWARMAIGDGNGKATLPTESQTALVHETYRSPLNQLSIDPQNPNYIVAETVVPSSVGGWYVHEVGIFDDAGDLVVVANFPGTYKPQLSDGSGSDLVIRVVVQVANTSAVNLKIDPAITLASRKWTQDTFVAKSQLAGGNAKQVLIKSTDNEQEFRWEYAASLLSHATQKAGGIVRLATPTEAQALADDSAPLTPSTLVSAFSGNHAKTTESGYQRFPNGLILQWGLAISGINGDASIVFPIAFPKAVFRAVVCEGAANSWAPTTAIVYGAFEQTKTGMKIRCRSIQGTAGPVVGPGVYSHWFAIGH